MNAYQIEHKVYSKSYIIICSAKFKEAFLTPTNRIKRSFNVGIFNSIREIKLWKVNNSIETFKEEFSNISIENLMTVSNIETKKLINQCEIENLSIDFENNLSIRLKQRYMFWIYYKIIRNSAYFDSFIIIESLIRI